MFQKAFFVTCITIMLILLVCITPFSARTSSIGITPSSNYPGANVTVYARGFTPDISCALTFDRYDTLAGFSADGIGSVNASFTVHPQAQTGPGGLLPCPITIR